MCKLCMRVFEMYVVAFVIVFIIIQLYTGYIIGPKQCGWQDIFINDGILPLSAIYNTKLTAQTSIWIIPLWFSGA